MSPWPDYARVLVDGHRIGWRGPVQRTQYDDGAVRQALAGREMLRVIDLTVLVESDADRTRFSAWVAALGSGWARLPAGAGGPESGRRLARIAGGRGGVQWTARSRHGRRTWEATLQLESPESYRETGLWDPNLKLGSASHVFARSSQPIQRLADINGLPAYNIPLSDGGGAQQLPTAFRSSDDTVPVWLDGLQIRLSGGGQILFHLAPQQAPGTPFGSGPTLNDDASEGLSQILRAGDRTLVVTGIYDSTAPPVEPYRWAPAGLSETRGSRKTEGYYVRKTLRKSG